MLGAYGFCRVRPETDLRCPLATRWRRVCADISEAGAWSEIWRPA
jgi:hypothetical protein